MKRLFALTLMLLCLTSAALAWDPDEVYEAYSRVMEIPSLGETQYYCQEDPLWRYMLYESEASAWNERRFWEAGCGPTAAAMAIAKLVEPSRLPVLGNRAGYRGPGFPFCECSVIHAPCFHGHPARTLNSPEDYRSYLPVAVAAYAAGNNARHILLRTDEPGTNSQLFALLAEEYGLGYQKISEWEAALEALRRGGCAVANVKNNAFTASSHYLFLAGVDDAYLYVLDPDIHHAYARDKKGYLDVLEPGLVRIRLEDVPAIRFHRYYVFEAPR